MSGVGWRPELRACPLCGSERRRDLGRGGGRSHRAGLGVETTIVRCRDCHGVYSRPMLLPEGNPYEASTADEYFHAHEPAQKVAMGAAIAAQARALLGRAGRLLEHLYDPADCLRRVHDGGLVFIDVPNECSLFTRLGNAYMRLRGRPWAVNLSPTFPPFHVVGFCPSSLRRLLRRAASRFWRW
jgi:hypothetical protein